MTPLTEYGLADRHLSPTFDECEGGECDGEYNGPESEDNYATWCDKHQRQRDGEDEL